MLTLQPDQEYISTYQMAKDSKKEMMDIHGTGENLLSMQVQGCGTDMPGLMG